MARPEVKDGWGGARYSDEKEDEDDEDLAVPFESCSGDAVDAVEVVDVCVSEGGCPKYTLVDLPSRSSANACMSLRWNGDNDLACQCEGIT